MTAEAHPTAGRSHEIDWRDIEGVILDVDGTLFDHVAVRRPLLTRMLSRLATRRMTLSDLRTIQCFRRERDRLALDAAEEIGRLQFELTAAKIGRPIAEVEGVVSRWIYDEPIAFIERFAFPGARQFVAALRRRGIRVGVFSDYPAEAKLRALGIDVDVVRDATLPDCGRLKPSPQGLMRVAELLHVEPQRCLVIGDRDDRDGEAARRAGFRFLRKTHRRGAKIANGEFASFLELVRGFDENGASPS